MYYKNSKYNHAIKHNNKFYIYNSVTGSIIELFDTDKCINIVKNLKYNHILLKKEDIIKINDIVDEEFCLLEKNGFLLTEDINEDNSFSKKVDRIKKKKEKKIIFLFTEECNFRCNYCFQEHLNKKMDKVIINDFIVLIKKIVKEEDVNDVEITYYGGEPLLEQENVLFTHVNLNKVLRDKIKSYNLITNGYLLTETFLTQLYNSTSYKVNKKVSIQVTIDGIKSIHDERRKLIDGSGTYNKIIDNINIATNYFKIVIRINVDKLSINYLQDLVEELKIKIQNKNMVTISPDYVYVSTLSNQNYEENVLTEDKDVLLKMDKFKKELIKAGFKLSFNNIVPAEYGSFPLCRPKYVYCSAVSGNQLVFSSEGNIFTCLEHVSNDKFKVGNIYESPTLSKRYSMWKDYNIAYFEGCNKCEFNLFCAGGCPSKLLCKTDKLMPKCQKQSFLAKVDEVIY